METMVRSETTQFRSRVGPSRHSPDTVGFKVSAGDLEVEEARDLLGVN